MLAVASPISLATATNFSRSSKDQDGPQQHGRGSGIEAILKDTVEFVEGSSTGALIQAEPKYPYINDDSPRVSIPLSSSKKLFPTATPSLHTPQHSLYDRPIITSWTASRERSAGFINTGNTCFLNSVLQCLIHTAPLQRLLQRHGTQDEKCRVTGPFCMTCNLKTVMTNGFQRTTPFVPTPIVKNLKSIAKHMRHGRQEDAHEFLRYTVDGLQHSCLAGYSLKIDTKMAQTTWVHKLFGGRLRSRVTCKACSHPSDTFDAILDLSLDIQNVSSLKQALAKFVQVDYLRGANKYKCERCKRPVNAEKQFTVHDAPVCLTVHLKRFTPLGRKMGHTVEYGHTLDLQPAMSEGQHGPRYSLYGVISHVGSGPNSGHYYAHVKGPDGRWYDANDESVTLCPPSSVIGRKNAYMLFYMRQQGDALGEAIGSHGAGARKFSAKRKIVESDDDDRGIRATGADSSPSASHNKAQFIGPQLPSPKPSQPDPQAVALRTKITKAKAAAESVGAKPSLVPYSSDAEEEEEGELRDVKHDVTPRNSSPTNAPSPPSSATVAPRTSSPIPTTSSYSKTPKKRKSPDIDESHGDAKRRRQSPDEGKLPPSSATIAPRTSSPIPATSFYGKTPKKRKSPDIDSEFNGDAKRRRPSPEEETKRPPKRSLGTPFTSSNMSNNLHASRDGQNNEFNPPNRSPKQRIAGVGGTGLFHPSNKRLTNRMKPRTLV